MLEPTVKGINQNLKRKLGEILERPALDSDYDDN